MQISPNNNEYFDIEQYYTYNALIRVRVLSVNTIILLDVFEGPVHETTLTAMVTGCGGAVNQVLLTEGHELAGLAEVLAFQGASL